jgi:hypothetical protein
MPHIIFSDLTTNYSADSALVSTRIDDSWWRFIARQEN